MLNKFNKEFSLIVQNAATVCESNTAFISFKEKEHIALQSSVGLLNKSEQIAYIAFEELVQSHTGIIECTSIQQALLFEQSPLFSALCEKSTFACIGLRKSDDSLFGVLCVTYKKHTSLTNIQRSMLTYLASNAEAIIEQYAAISIAATKQKRMVQELNKNRELVHRISQLSGVGDWEINLKDNSIYWSKETRRIHGVDSNYQPEFNTAIRFFAPEARSTIVKAIETAKETGQHWDVELPFIQQNGKRIWVRSVGSVEFENGKPVRIIGAFQDISEQRRQISLMDEAHTRMALATSSGKIGVWELNLAQQTIIWDERMYKLYGLTPANRTEEYELWSAHLHPDDKARVEVELNQAISATIPFDTEYRIIWTDNSVHHIKATGRVTYDDYNAPIKMIGVNWDVSELKKATEKLSEQRELLEVTLESIGDAVITTDANGNTNWLNPVAQHLTGWNNQDAKGRPLGQIFHIVNEDTRLRTENPVETCLTQGRIVGLANHTVLISKSGREHGIEDSAAPIRNSSGKILGAILVFHDVTEQRRLSNEISYQATHDSLTNLVNRLEFETRLRRLLQQSFNEKNRHALLYIDLDQFKIVNDTCGHAVGDKLLKQVSLLLNGLIRERDTLARLGGDEFGVIFEHCSAEQALRVAESICNKMENFRFIHESRRFQIGASIGLVAIDEQWSTSTALMQAADKSCYAAKDAGRNRVHVWSNTDQAIRTRHGEMQWTTRIENALDDKRFELHAQKITDLHDNTTGIHAEVLVRMKDEDGSLILPDVFFPAAERFHLASRIDRWVIENTVNWFVSQPKATFNKINMLCLNLSGQSIGDLSFHRFATDILTNIDTKIRTKLCIEITETAAITSLSEASLFIEQISNLGVKVALDDFGAGASSFNYIKNLSVDILKIDGQFIQDLLEDPLDEATVRCFIEVAAIVNLKTVAEFVNSKAILRRVKELGIDYAQGFLLHKPAPIDQVFRDNLKRY